MVCNDGHLVDSIGHHICVHLALHLHHIASSDGAQYFNRLPVCQQGRLESHLLFGYFLVSLRLFNSSVHVHIAFFPAVQQK